MLHNSQDVNFARNSLNVIDVVDLPLFKDLNRNALSSIPMNALLDFAESALSESSLDLVIADEVSLNSSRSDGTVLKLTLNCTGILYCAPVLNSNLLPQINSLLQNRLLSLLERILIILKWQSEAI